MSDQPSRRSARAARGERLDQPREQRPTLLPRMTLSQEAFGILSEQFARFMGTASFLIGMTLFVVIWISWNVLAGPLIFDPFPFIFLTLMLSLQASYAAPLILLAQNRQADRDRVGLEQDRARDERNLADTEYLTREVASLRLALREQATRDFVRSELRDLLGELEERSLIAADPDAPDPDKKERRGKSPKAAKVANAARPERPDAATGERTDQPG